VNDGDRDEFLDVFADHRDVERFLDEWWRPVDPREVLLWLADAGRTGRYVAGVFSAADGKALAASYRLALDTGTWSVADAALVDDLSARLGLVPERTDVERGFYEVELLDEVEAEAVALGSLRGDGDGGPARAAVIVGWDIASVRRGRPVPAAGWTPRGGGTCCSGAGWGRPGDYAHVLVDEGAGPVADAVADAGAAWPIGVVDRGRGRRAGLVGRRRGGGGGARRRVRPQRAPAVPHGHELPQTPGRSSTTRQP
jgi:hypothetical protein